MHRWDNKGSGWGQAALGTAPPRHGPSAAPEKSLLSTPPPFRGGVASKHLGQTLGIVWSLQRPRKARKKEKDGKRVRIKNERGSKAIGKPYASFGKIGFPHPSLNLSHPKRQPPRPKVAAGVAKRELPKLRGSEPRRQGENGRVGWAWLAGGRARTKPPAPPTWS